MKGHILFSCLAYALWKTLEGWMERAGLGRGSVRTLVEEMRRVKACDAVLPTSAGRPVRVRCVIRPEPALQALLDRLDLGRAGTPGPADVGPGTGQREGTCSLDFESRMPLFADRAHRLDDVPRRGPRPRLPAGRQACRFVTATEPPLYASDHFPVVADLLLP